MIIRVGAEFLLINEENPTIEFSGLIVTIILSSFSFSLARFKHPKPAKTLNMLSYLSNLIKSV